MKCDRIYLVIHTETNSSRITVRIKFIESVLVDAKGAQTHDFRSWGQKRNGQIKSKSRIFKPVFCRKEINCHNYDT